MPKALVFDFFGVICSEISPQWLRSHVSEMRAQALKDSYVAAADRNKLSQEALFSALSGDTHIPAFQIEQEWFALVHIDEQMISLIRNLKPHYKLGLLTNSPSSFLRSILAQHNLTDLFDSIIVSSEIGSAKPDPEIFIKMLESLPAEPQEVVMIDDNRLNVEAAKKIGMQGIVFKSYEQLKNELP